MTDLVFDCSTNLVSGFKGETTNKQGPGVQFNTGSPVIGNGVDTITFYISNPDEISGTTSAYHYASDGTLRNTSIAVDNSTVGTGMTTITFTFSTPLSIATDDCIVAYPSQGTSMQSTSGTTSCVSNSAFAEFKVYPGSPSNPLIINTSYSYYGTVSYSSAPPPPSSDSLLFPPPVAWI